MKNHKKWKKALSLTFAFAVTAGALSNNASGFLLENRMTAFAAEAAEKPVVTEITHEEKVAAASESTTADAVTQAENTSTTSAEDVTLTAAVESAEPVKTDKAVRTVMLYLCGADLETKYTSATFSLEQILSSDFGADEDVRLIVMTGGSNKWHTESGYLYDPATGTSPEEISSEYNQVWEAKSISSAENPGKLVLLDGDGLSGDGENARKSVDEPMCDPETLKSFINYSVENFPAEKYDLILWDHGGGPNGGFGVDEHVGDSMSFAGLIDAFSDNAVTNNGGKFDIINFDACMMGSLDLILAFADYTDYYIASPETIPGYSQEYTGWLNAVGEDPDIDSFELGKIIVDDMISFYGNTEELQCEEKATLAVIDNKKLLGSGIVSAVTDYAELLKKDLDQPNKNGEYYFYDEFFAWGSSIQYASIVNNSYNYYDLGVVMNILSGNFINFVDGNDITVYKDVADRILAVLNDPEIIYAKGTQNVSTNEPVVYIDKDGSYAMGDFGTSGIYLPAVNQDGKSTAIDYYAALDEAAEQIKDGEIKNFLKKYIDVINDYNIIAETGYAVSALSDSGIKKSDITYDKICDYWHEGYVPEGYDESIQWMRMSYCIDKHPGGEEAVREWLAPYISQIADEVISPDNVSVQVIEGSKGRSFTINTEDTHKRLIDSVNLTYTAELPVVEEYWENSPKKEDRYDICPDLVLGQREAEVQIDLEDGENPADALFRWFDNRSSVWNIDSVNDKWYAVSDADGVLHVAAIENTPDGYISVDALAYDEDGDEALASLYFMNGDLKYIKLYSSDFTSSVSFSVSDISFKLRLMPVYVDTESGDYLKIPLSKSAFDLSAENAGSIKLLYTNAANIPDIDDIDGDGRAITESLVITDMYKYSFDITDKLHTPAGILKSIADAAVESIVCDGTEKRPVVVYDGNVLTEGTDYTILNESQSEAFSDPGNYDITVYGRGEYGGTLETNFNIYAADDFASPEKFEEMSKIDYEKKTGVSADTTAVRNTDGTVTVTIADNKDNVLDVYTVDAKTGTGTDEAGEKVNLPQTGMSGAHKVVTGLAALILLTGAALVKKSRKED